MTSKDDSILDDPHPGGGPTDNDSFIIGVSYAVGYYAAGFLIAYVIYTIIGDPYPHALGIHQIVVCVLVLAGAGWTIVMGIKTLVSGTSKQVKGGMLVNALVALAVVTFAILVYNTIRSGREQIESKYNKPSERKLYSRHIGDTVMVYDEGEIVYMRVRDSVLVNELDSLEIQTGVRRD